MNILDTIFKKGADAVVGSVGKAIDRVFTNDEERMKAQAGLDQIKVELEKEINRHLETIAADATKQIEIEAQDRANSRARESEFVKATGHMDWMMTAVGILVMITFMATMLFVATQPLPIGSEHIIINAMGIMEGLVLSVVTYYYGSSAGSRIKDMKK